MHHDTRVLTRTMNVAYNVDGIPHKLAKGTIQPISSIPDRTCIVVPLHERTLLLEWKLANADSDNYFKSFKNKWLFGSGCT